MVNRKFVILVASIAFASITLSLIIISLTNFSEIPPIEDRNNNDFNKIVLDDESLFVRSTDKNAFVTKDGKKIWYSLEFKLKPELK
ncbi:MAG: hypothetical protein ACT4OW_02030, partial [Nitrososphaerota archaeon]